MFELFLLAFAVLIFVALLGLAEVIVGLAFSLTVLGGSWLWERTFGRKAPESPPLTDKDYDKMVTEYMVAQAQKAREVRA